MVATNSGTDAGGSYYFGHSMIVTPIAWRLAQARGGEEIIAAKLDPDPLRYVTWGSKSLQTLTISRIATWGFTKSCSKKRAPGLNRETATLNWGVKYDIEKQIVKPPNG